MSTAFCRVWISPPSKAWFSPRGAQLVEAADRQGDDIGVPGDAVQRQHALGDALQADAGDAALHAGEEFRHQRARQADGLEIVSAAVAADDRDAHLGHHLQQPLVHRLLVVGDAVLQRGVAEQPAPLAVGDALLRQIGVHRGGADADQHGEVMHVEAFGRADVQAGEGAQRLPHQMRVHAAGRQDHRDRRARRALVLIGQDDMGAAGAHALLGLAADAVDGAAQAGLALGRPGRCSPPRRRWRPCSCAWRRIRRSTAPGCRASACRTGSGPRRGCCPRLPRRVFRVITRVSRRLSIGGLVTWLKVWRKIMVQRRDTGPDSTAIGVSSPMLPMASGAVLHHRVQDSLQLLQRDSRRRAGGGAVPRPAAASAHPPRADDARRCAVMRSVHLPKGCRAASACLQLGVAVEAGPPADRRRRTGPGRPGPWRGWRLPGASPCRSRSRRSAARSPAEV